MEIMYVSECDECIIIYKHQCFSLLSFKNVYTFIYIPLEMKTKKFNLDTSFNTVAFCCHYPKFSTKDEYEANW